MEKSTISKFASRVAFARRAAWRAGKLNPLIGAQSALLLDSLGAAMRSSDAPSVSCPAMIVLDAPPAVLRRLPATLRGMSLHQSLSEVAVIPQPNLGGAIASAELSPVAHSAARCVAQARNAAQHPTFSPKNDVRVGGGDTSSHVPCGAAALRVARRGFEVAAGSPCESISSLRPEAPVFTPLGMDVFFEHFSAVAHPVPDMQTEAVLQYLGEPSGPLDLPLVPTDIDYSADVWALPSSLNDVWWQLSELKAKVDCLQDPLQDTTSFRVFDSKLEKHDRLIERLWELCSEYKSAIDMLSDIRKSHEKLSHLVDYLDNKQLSDAVKDACPPPVVSTEPPKMPSIEEFHLPIMDRYLIDIVEYLSAADIISACGFKRVTKKELSGALSDDQIQSCLNIGFRRGEYDRPFRVQSWLAELLSYKLIREAPTVAPQEPQRAHDGPRDDPHEPHQSLDSSRLPPHVFSGSSSEDSAVDSNSYSG